MLVSHSGATLQGPGVRLFKLQNRHLGRKAFEMQSVREEVRKSAVGDYLLFDRETRAPKKKLPKGTVDSQIHLFGPLDKYPLHETAIYGEPSADFAASRRMHRALGVERCVLVQSHMYGHAHECMLDALAEGGDVYRGCGLIDDSTPDSELQRLHDAGVRGARFNFYRKVKHVFDGPSFKRTVARIADMGWYVKIHPEDGELEAIEDLLSPLKMPVLIDHLARPATPDPEDPTVKCAIRLLGKGNVYIMLSNPHRFTNDAQYTDLVPMIRAYVDAAPDRCVWATDWPHPLTTKRMPNDGELADFILDICDDSECQAIFVDNPVRLFGY